MSSLKTKLIAALVAGSGFIVLALVSWEAMHRWDRFQSPAEQWEDRWALLYRTTGFSMPEPHQTFVALRTRPPVSWLGLDVPIGEIEPVHVADPRLPGSCAVVGSSRNLTHWGQGAFIDSHDHIFRMNLAPTRGFEEDVGGRTTHAVLNRGFAVKLLKTGEPKGRWRREVPVGARIIMNGELLAHQIVGRMERGQALRVSLAPDRLWFYSEALVSRVYLLSTGLKTALFAAHFCDSVNLFGFGADSQGRWDYYYRSGYSDAHDEGWEKGILKALSSLSLVTLYEGNVHRQPVSKL